MTEGERFINYGRWVGVRLCSKGWVSFLKMAHEAPYINTVILVTVSINRPNPIRGHLW